MTTYQLTLTDSQAYVLRDALELLARIGMGQYQEIVNESLWNKLVPVENLEPARDLLDQVHVVLTGFQPHAYYGIANREIHDRYRVAWDLYQVVRHRLAWDRNPDGGIFVDFDQPRPVSAVPLATIDKANPPK